MTSLAMKVLVILLVFLGEGISIYAELWGAKHLTNSSMFLQVFLKMLLIITLGGGLLILGYMLGFSAFKNIWVIIVTSITSILIVEPLMAYAFFQQIPTKGAIVGLICGALGFLATLFL